MKKGYTIQVLDHGFVRYIDHMGTDTDIVEAARVSYQAGSKSREEDERLLHYLWKNRHTSPFEMIKVKFDVKLPIFVARQWVRHRMQNMNELSGRYSVLPREFYVPNIWRGQDKVNKQGSTEAPLNHKDLSQHVIWHCNNCYTLYEELLEKGAARELARMVLPLNIYTQFYCCWDMKNLLHFITLRDDSHAQAEIQEYGRAVKKICRELFPVTMAAYERFKWRCVDTISENTTNDYGGL